MQLTIPGTLTFCYLSFPLRLASYNIEILGHEPYSNKAYRKTFAHAMTRVWNFKVTVLDVIEDPVANKVVIFANSTADSKAGEGTYGQTYMLTLEFEETGEKIKKMIESVDSAKASGYSVGRFVRHRTAQSPLKLYVRIISLISKVLLPPPNPYPLHPPCYEHNTLQSTSLS